MSREGESFPHRKFAENSLTKSALERCRVGALGNEVERVGPRFREAVSVAAQGEIFPKCKDWNGSAAT